MITILGSHGMLGSAVAKEFPQANKLNRPMIDATKYDAAPSAETYQGVVINCIGLIKPYCDDIPAAIKVNALFPHSLPRDTIQIATDCVFSGRNGGHYVEIDDHDATDVYGQTKSLGEAAHLRNLRCSIIGREEKNHLSLLDWALAQDEVQGYTNHLWNGITTYHFAKICRGIIDNDLELPPLQHIVPADVVTKAELLRLIAKYMKPNLVVRETKTPITIDRTLATLNPTRNQQLWQAAGYSQPPTIEEMIAELASS